MAVKPSGSFTSVRLVQSRKTASPKLVTLSGTVKLLIFEQPLKAELPMLVTLSGTVMSSKLVHPQNA